MTDYSGRVDCRTSYSVGLLNLASREESGVPGPTINDFPAEILGRIFEDVVFVPGGYATYDQLDRRSGNPYNITLVSRHWRDVAYSTPQLWVILPGHYTQWWDRILKRSGTMPLRIEWYRRAPIERQLWPLRILADPACYSRIQGLKLEWYTHELRGHIRAFTLGYSLQHVHLAGGTVYKVWDDRTDFLTFIEGLPRMSYLGLEGGCIPEMVSNHTVPTPHTRFNHPALRWLYLSGWAWRVFRFLEFVSLQTLERLELHAKCLQDISDIECQNPQSVFQDFWKGRKDAPRSLAFAPSVGILEITFCQCQTTSHEHSYSPNALLLKITATGFQETAQVAWKTLAKVMLLKDAEEVVLHNVPM